MERTKRTAFLRRVTCGFFSLFQISVFVATAVILSVTNEEWSTPIRTWLTAILVLYIIHPIFTLISEIVLYHLENNELSLQQTQWYVNLAHTLFIVVIVVWFVVGNVLYFVADGWGVFYEGYELALALIITHYIIFGMVYLAFCGSYLSFLRNLKQPVSTRSGGSPRKVPLREVKEIEVTLEDMAMHTRV